MKNLSPSETLKQEIALLEVKRDEELKVLKEQVHIVAASLNPVNVIKNTFRNMMHPQEGNGGLGGTVFSIISGYLVKNIFFRNSRNPLKMVARNVIQNMASNLAANNSDKIISWGQKILHALLSKLNMNHDESN